jgi:hypothetical protein
MLFLYAYYLDALITLLPEILTPPPHYENFPSSIFFFSARCPW